jgi:hypothetical protein
MATTNGETFAEIVLTSPDGNVGVEISLTGDSQHISLVAALLVQDGVGGGWARDPTVDTKTLADWRQSKFGKGWLPKVNGKKKTGRAR